MKRHPGPGRDVARVPAPDRQVAAAELPGSRSDIQAAVGSCGTAAIRLDDGLKRQ
jgi:hypothetical protein